MPTQESSLSPTIEEAAAQVALGDVCHVCGRWTRGDSVALEQLPEDLAQLIRANAPTAKDLTEVCGRCARLFARAKDHIIARCGAEQGRLARAVDTAQTGRG